MNPDPRIAALSHYESCYRNSSYKTAQTSLLKDVFGDDFDKNQREQLLSTVVIYPILNLLTDTALEICGLTEAHGKGLILLEVLKQKAIRPASQAF